MSQPLSVDFERILKAKEFQSLDDGSGDVVFALFLEPHEPPPGSGPPSLLDRIVSFVVENLQPSPVMTHVELVVPCRLNSSVPVSFATYIGSVSDWQSSRKNNEFYYLTNNANQWRAVPVFGKAAARLVREACDDSVGIKYSLLRYATASKMLRGLAGMMADKTRSPGHCATLTARILRRAIGDRLKHPSAWYGPATLFAELSEDLQQKQVAPETTLMSPETASAVDSVLRHSSEDLFSLSDESWMSAIRALTLKTASAETYGDSAMQKLTQKQLATALLRWSVIRHSPDDGHRMFST